MTDRSIRRSWAGSSPSSSAIPASGASDLAGRLTHAATGVASHFDSADELIALLRAESARLREASPRRRQPAT